MVCFLYLISLRSALFDFPLGACILIFRQVIAGCCGDVFTMSYPMLVLLFLRLVSFQELFDLRLLSPLSTLRVFHLTSPSFPTYGVFSSFVYSVRAVDRAIPFRSSRRVSICFLFLWLTRSSFAVYPSVSSYVS